MDTIMIVKIFSFSDKVQYGGGGTFSTELSGSFFSIDAMVKVDEQLQWYVVLLTRTFYTPTPAAFQTAPCILLCKKDCRSPIASEKEKRNIYICLLSSLVTQPMISSMCEHGYQIRWHLLLGCVQ